MPEVAQHEVLKKKLPANPDLSTAGRIALFFIEVLEAVEEFLTLWETVIEGTGGGVSPVLFGVWNLVTVGGTVLGYLDARKENAKQAMMDGFALGVVVAAHGRNATTLKWLFGGRQFYNSYDPESAKIARRAYVTALAAGFAQGAELNQDQKKYLIRDLELRSGHRYGKAEYENETRIKWWYEDMAHAFEKTYER
jgi:hypothetical protein